jgi:hypothetical protein
MGRGHVTETRVEGEEAKLGFPHFVSVFTFKIVGSSIISVFSMIININMRYNSENMQIINNLSSFRS